MAHLAARCTKLSSVSQGQAAHKDKRPRYDTHFRMGPEKLTEMSKHFVNEDFIQ